MVEASSNSKMLTWSQTFGRLKDSIVAKTARKSWMLLDKAGVTKRCIIWSRRRRQKGA